ncbi:MAG: Calx-beta domain-containing protein [Bacteroidales bacterium]
MKKVSILKYGVLLSLLALFSCDDEEYKNQSTMVPTTPTITVSGIPTSIDFVEQDSTFSFNLSMSVAQTVDVAVAVKQVAGDATEGVDFKILNDGGEVKFAAGATAATVKVKVLADDIFEETESFTIQIGDETTANATITPVTIPFTIKNKTYDDLAIEMSWDAVAYDQYGEQISSTTIADMILQLYDASETLVDESDGASFESLVLSGTAPDGKYYVRASFYSAMQFDDPVNVDLALDFAQEGVFTSSEDFVTLVNTATSELCGYQINLVEIVKSGKTYTITKTGNIQFEFDNADFVGTYDGTDGSYKSGRDWRFSNPVTLALSGDDVTLDGLCYAWLANIWGETVTASTPVVITFNTDGTLTIADQPYVTTDYEGSPYNYSISGTGTYSLCDPISLHIEYDLYNTTDDYSLGAWLLANGYSATDYFIADIQLGAKASKALIEKVKISKPNK